MKCGVSPLGFISLRATSSTCTAVPKSVSFTVLPPLSTRTFSAGIEEEEVRRRGRRGREGGREGSAIDRNDKQIYLIGD